MYPLKFLSITAYSGLGITYVSGSHSRQASGISTHVADFLSVRRPQLRQHLKSPTPHSRTYILSAVLKQLSGFVRFPVHVFCSSAASFLSFYNPFYIFFFYKSSTIGLYICANTVLFVLIDWVLP